jgi:hypothetical protein
MRAALCHALHHHHHQQQQQHCSESHYVYCSYTPLPIQWVPGALPGSKAAEA